MSIDLLNRTHYFSFGSLSRRRNAVFLGESHSSAADKLLALRIIRDLNVRPCPEFDRRECASARE